MRVVLDCHPLNFFDELNKIINIMEDSENSEVLISARCLAIEISRLKKVMMEGGERIDD